MTQEYFYKLVEHEIEWLRYYSTRESKSKLTIDSNIYSELVPMGYVKRKRDLDLRCSPGLITSKDPITEKTTIEELEQTTFPRLREKNNRYTPLETLFIILPDKRQEYLDKLIPKPIDMSPPKTVRTEGKFRIRIE